MIKLIIPGELTDLNAYIKGINSHYLMGNKIKRANTERVRDKAFYTNCKKVTEYPVTISFIWYSKDEKKDIDNVAFSKKFVMDGLVEAGVLKDDSRKYIDGFEDRFEIDKKNPRVEIIII
jgi:Holliday junction resolvase RusA-like endonuclease